MKLPAVAPAATITVAGTVSAALFDESATVAPPVSAAFDSVTVQLDVPPDTTDAGAQPSAVTVGSAITVTGAVAVPFNVAVTVTD